jgi:hypothetical protein
MAAVIDNRTHRVFAYRRKEGIGKIRRGILRWSGLGYIGATRILEDIATMFKVEVETVRNILSFAEAHMFVEMIPNYGGTGYFRLIPKESKAPRTIAEPDDPRDDDLEADDEILPDA